MAADLIHTFDIVKLYYPNDWMKNIGDLVPAEDRRFSWFLCAQRYMGYQGKEKGYYLIEINPTIQFYCQATGKTLKIKPDDEDEKKPVLLLIGDLHNQKKLKADYNKDFSTSSEKEDLLQSARIITELFPNIDGIALQHQPQNPTGDFLCPEATFVFKSDILEVNPRPGRCGIIHYSKKNNSRIREVIKEFPTCTNIDDVLKKYPCEAISKVLYQHLLRFWET